MNKILFNDCSNQNLKHNPLICLSISSVVTVLASMSLNPVWNISVYFKILKIYYAYQ